MNDFPRLKRLPPYVFSLMDELKTRRLQEGAELVDLGMGNPDQPTPPHIVEALQAAARNPKMHRYIPTRGMHELRQSICHWYQKRFGVSLDPESEAMVTIGSKEGLAHLALVTVGEEDSVLVPNPCYPVHQFGFVIADAEILFVPLLDNNFIENLQKTIESAWPKPKVLILNFPCNPTTQCVDLEFFRKIVAIAKEYKIWVIHDLAYADIVFDGYKAPSILQVPGAKEVAVESYTLSKTYNMAGWRLGFMCGNPTLVNALIKIKSYLDYGTFGAIQVAAMVALEGPQDCVQTICETYRKRRDVLCAGLKSLGFEFEIPKATMFVWAKIPKQFKNLSSLEFAKLLLNQAGVVVSPGIGFGDYGNHHVRFSLIEDEARLKIAVQKIGEFMQSYELKDEIGEEVADGAI